MKTNHLRLGNLLNHKIYGECIVTAIDSEAIRVKTKNLIGEEWFPIDHFTPIKLTDEIMSALGYKKDTDGIIKISKVMFWLDVRIVQIAAGYAPITNIKCESLHQLQNLLFSLKGEEIEFTNYKHLG